MQFDTEEQKVVAQQQSRQRQMKKGRLKTVILGLVKIVFTATLFWIIFSHIDLGDVKARLAQLSLGTILIVILFIIIHMVLSAIRWREILQELGGVGTFRVVLLATLLERFISQAVPSPVFGDSARVVALVRNGNHVRNSAYSVVVDRVFALGGMFGVAAIASPFAAYVLHSKSALVSLWTIAAFSVVTVLTLAICPQSLWVELRKVRVLHYAAGLAVALRRFLLEPHIAPFTVGLSLVVQSLPIFCFYVIGRNLGIDIRLIDMIVLVPNIMIASMLPFSVSGWGIREGAAIILLAEASIGRADAVAMSVIFGLITLTTSCIGALVWFAMSYVPSNQQARTKT